MRFTPEELKTIGSEFTKKSFRKKVEQAMSLEPGTLNTGELKTLVLDIALDYIVGPRSGAIHQNVFISHVSM